MCILSKLEKVNGDVEGKIPSLREKPQKHIKIVHNLLASQIIKTNLKVIKWGKKIRKLNCMSSLSCFKKNWMNWSSPAARQAHVAFSVIVDMKGDTFIWPCSKDNPASYKMTEKHVNSCYGISLMNKNNKQTWWNQTPTHAIPKTLDTQ